MAALSQPIHAGMFLMPSAMEKRFAAQIPWIIFKNKTGQTLPPFSCIVAQQWNLPSISGGDLNVQSPYFVAGQPTDPINPYLLYLTNDVQVPPDGFGFCAQPQQYPQLAALNLNSGSDYTQPVYGETCGPLSGNFTLTLDAPAFLIVGIPENNNYVFVLTYTGLYRGNLPSATSITTGLVQVTTFVEPAGTPSSITYPVCNPYGNVDTTQGGINPRCTYGWVGGRWEIVSADPCPDTFAPCPSQNRYGS
jgi:hypothetical protein